MKRTFSLLAFSGVVALGLAAGASSAQASAVSATGMAAKAASTAEQSTAGNVVEVKHRRHRKHRRSWRRKRPSTTFHLQFGLGGYRYAPPYYAPPRYVQPRRAAPRHVRGLPPAHVRWCYDRYRSYRHTDNSFQPYHGPRKACRSPYYR